MGLAQRYLAFLARHLHERDTRELAWWELHLALPLMVRLVIGLVPGLVVAGLVGILVGIMALFLLADLPAAGPVASLVAGLASLVAGLMVVLWFVRGKKPSPSRMNLRIRGRMGELARSVRRPLAVFLVFGPVAGYLATFRFSFSLEDSGVPLWLVFGLLFGLVGGFGVGLVKWLRTPADYALAMTPQSVLKSDRIVTPMIWFSIWLLFALMAGLALGFLDALIQQSENGDVALASSLVVGLMLGLLVGLQGVGVWAYGRARGFVRANRLGLVRDHTVMDGPSWPAALASDDLP